MGFAFQAGAVTDLDGGISAAFGISPRTVVRGQILNARHLSQPTARAMGHRVIWSLLHEARGLVYVLHSAGLERGLDTHTLAVL